MDMKKPPLPTEVLEFFQRTGAQGGKARVEKHSPEQLSAWGKMGGRPKGSGKKQAAKRAKKQGRKGGG
jgi:general stress protein YciG